MNNLPTDIEVQELLTGAFRETHYRLPRRTLRGAQIAAGVGFAVAIGCILVPFVFAGFFAIVVPNDDREFRLIAILMPIVFFGSFLFPIAIYALVRTAFNYYGHLEVQCQRERILVTQRCGHLRWTSRFRLAGLKGFRVKWGTVTDEQGKPVAPALYDVGTLVADYDGGRSRTVCWGYAPDWLEQFAADLTNRCEALSDSTSGLTPVSRDNIDPTAIGPRSEQPSTSTARVTTNGDRLVIDIPRRGWWRCVPGGFKFFCISWNGFNCLFFGMFFPALFAGQMLWNEGPEKTSVAFGLLFSLPFLLIGWGMIAYWWAAAKYAARLEVVGDQLSVEETFSFGKFAGAWSSQDLRAVRVVSRASKGEDSMSWTTLLQIEPVQGSVHEMLATREKNELEWLATTLSKALGLPMPESAGTR